jgi:hypothetical protein
VLLDCRRQDLNLHSHYRNQALNLNTDICLLWLQRR